MKIRLYGYAIVASALTWAQVQEAEEKANASEAGQQFRFYRHLFQPETDAVQRWSLLAMPRIYDDRHVEGGDDLGWWIEITDGPENRPEQGG